MTMENEGERPDEGSEPEDSERWYFDLPSGAWERQEAKNRELRKRVRGKFEDVEAEPPVSDPFAPSSSSEPKPGRGQASLGLAPWKEPGRRYRGRGGNDPAPGRASHQRKRLLHG